MFNSEPIIELFKIINFSHHKLDRKERDYVIVLEN